ncbi:MAG: exodeoxyribonuclease III [Vicinamibacterales bacterium]
MKVLTWNVNGIRARQQEVAELIDREQPDVVCLQEIKAAPDKVPELIVAAGGYWCYWHGAGGYSGVALLVRHSFFTERPGFDHPSFDMENRIVVADLGSVVVASVYVPNGGKDYPAKLAFLDGLLSWVAETKQGGRSVLICGDLNVAREERDVHPRERKPNQIGTRPEERGWMAGMLAQELVDVGRALDPDNDELFTWWAPWRNLRQRNIGWRIDYMLASPALAKTATAMTAMREFGTSDHAPVVATFS